jgi:DNA-binding XRE family transcriptional regulator
MAKRVSERTAVVKMAGELMRAAKTGGDAGLVDIMGEVHARLRKPMADILRKVPGANVKQKAARIGISRQAWYDWSRGIYRPTGVQAKKLARLTGVPVEHIRGKGETPRKRRKASAAPAVAPDA